VINHLILLSVFLLTVSCSRSAKKPQSLSGNEKTTGHFQFGLNIPKLALSSSGEAHGIYVSITQGEKIVVEKKFIRLIRFTSAYIAEPLELPFAVRQDPYKLVEFIVTNSESEIMYVSPVEGAPLASHVSKPLPLNFTVEKDKVMKLIPEVISAADKNPDDFGYEVFEFEVIEVPPLNSLEESETGTGTGTAKAEEIDCSTAAKEKAAENNKKSPHQSKNITNHNECDQF
jgi:hypothetical protein